MTEQSNQPDHFDHCAHSAIREQAHLTEHARETIPLGELTVDVVDPDWLEDIVGKYQFVHPTYLERHFIMFLLVALCVPWPLVITGAHTRSFMLMMLPILLFFGVMSTEAYITRDTKKTLDKQLANAEQAFEEFKNSMPANAVFTLVHHEGGTALSAAVTSPDHGNQLVTPQGRNRMRTNYIPLRPAYDLARYPERAVKDWTRRSIHIPNMWIPMRFADDFREIEENRPFSGFVNHQPGLRNPYVPLPFRFILWLRQWTYSAYFWLAPAAIALGIFVSLYALILFIVVFLSVPLIVQWYYESFGFTTGGMRMFREQPCLLCGYSLRNLTPHKEGEIMHCPECGCSLTTLDVCLSRPRRTDSN